MYIGYSCYISLYIIYIRMYVYVLVHVAKLINIGGIKQNYSMIKYVSAVRDIIITRR